MGPLCVGLFTSQSICGYPSWAPDPSARDQYDPRIYECGNIHSRVIHTLSILSDMPITSIKKHDHQPTTIDYNKLKPYFDWVNADIIKNIFENSTQWVVTSTRFPMRKHFKSRLPAFNIPCRNEALATDSHLFWHSCHWLWCYHGPIMTKPYMFGVDKSVVTSSTIPQSIPNKRHNMLSYDRVRKAIAAKILEFHWCSSAQNRSDILSKTGIMQKSKKQ